jgi:phage terminase large subunit-like protein
VDVVEGNWNKLYLNEMASFPGGDHDDYVDASSGAFLEVTAGTRDIDRWKALAA